MVDRRASRLGRSCCLTPFRGREFLDPVKLSLCDQPVAEEALDRPRHVAAAEPTRSRQSPTPVRRRGRQDGVSLRQMMFLNSVVDSVMLVLVPVLVRVSGARLRDFGSELRRLEASGGPGCRSPR